MGLDPSFKLDASFIWFFDFLWRRDGNKNTQKTHPELVLPIAPSASPDQLGFERVLDLRTTYAVSMDGLTSLRFRFRMAQPKA